MLRIRIRNLVIEKSRQDKRDCGAPRGAHVGEDLLEGGHRHGGYEGEDDEEGGDEGEAEVGHLDTAFGRGEEVRAGGGVRGLGGGATRAPFETGVYACAAGVDLEGVAEHDEDDDGEAADGRGRGGGVHHYDVAGYVVAVRKVPRYAG